MSVRETKLVKRSLGTVLWIVETIRFVAVVAKKKVTYKLLSGFAVFVCARALPFLFVNKIVLPVFFPRPE